ncbi:MAG: glycogen/starch/alpha-glucan phosphorylase [Proteobacteria bacterium]|nr:glycogen/starch/alpha-glucan phosphorylase [Pseudomonadota bacterium]
MEDYSQSSGISTEERVERFKASFEQRMALSIAHDMNHSSDLDKFRALALTVRDELIAKWLKTQETYYRKNPKRVYYFSLEYLIGRTLCNAALNLDMSAVMASAVEKLGYTLEDIAAIEWDAGLGNGGLGRLAACFLDSMATLELPAYGYGIRYEYGMFKQKIEKLQQQEYPDNWLRYGNPWEIGRTESHYKVHFMGRINKYVDRDGIEHSEWVDTDTVIALAFDIPIPGFKTKTVNTLKLWASSSTREFNLQTFNAGDYIGAIINKTQSETISKVLYPNDNNYEGKELRLKQQYFMVSASLQDIIVRLGRCGDDIGNLPEKAVIQLNDTHPSIAIPELMRILIDDKGFDWDEAWDITIRTFAYTNHTVLPEALEKWPVPLLENVLPRHMQIIYEINQQFLDLVAAIYPGDFERRKRMSIIEEGDPLNVRMAHLAIVGTFSVNGVAALHSKLLREGIFRDFHELFPEKFNNKTNGVTPRRWLRKANPLLSDLIARKIGHSWINELNELSRLEPLIEDEEFVTDWRAVKTENKKELAGIIWNECRIRIDVDSLFDVQVKRIHEYKRQLLNILHVITLYNRIKKGMTEDFVPRTVIFGGKAPPGYFMAKTIIHLINAVANLVNRDRTIGDLLKVVFLPNYGVSLAEKIIPGADLSEQISTAGMEASGTGNMKFALNGALTIGTLDGANIEILEEVGEENIFIFGNTADELIEIRNAGYNPVRFYEQDRELHQVLNQIRDGVFSPNEPSLFVPIFNVLQAGSARYFTMADYRAYVDCQAEVSRLFRDWRRWHEKAILNVARMGKFSTDRVIREYNDEIWRIEPCPVD